MVLRLLSTLYMLVLAVVVVPEQQNREVMAAPVAVQQVEIQVNLM
jgi:hypothetical protein